MRVVADQNIPQVAEAFAAFGAVEVVPSSAIDAHRCRDADIVLVRSTVKVGKPLLDGSSVNFVATSTIGTDHLDLDWLAQQRITVASAPGSNAQSVLEWWLQAVLLAQRDDLAGQRVGIVGVGQVGGRVQRLCETLGMEVVLCDPPRARAERDFPSVDIDELLPRVDILTVHTPLTRSGPDATVKLIDYKRLSRLREGALFVNAARGELMDGAAVLAAHHQRGLRLLLDVFPLEPSPDPALVAAARVATPHIAGHSLEGKLNGTAMIYRAACVHYGITPTWQPIVPPNAVDETAITLGHRHDQLLLMRLLQWRWHQPDDARALAGIMALPVEERAGAWRKYRDGYASHRELGGLRVRLSDTRPRLEAVLRLLGVDVAIDAARDGGFGRADDDGGSGSGSGSDSDTRGGANK